MEPEPLIPKHGGYRKLKSFQIAQLCYDVTVRFCDRTISPRSRTHDQMVQAARLGVQNIAEGSKASGTSKKFELKLTNVARASHVVMPPRTPAHAVLSCIPNSLTHKRGLTSFLVTVSEAAVDGPGAKQ